MTSTCSHVIASYARSALWNHSDESVAHPRKEVEALSGDSTASWVLKKDRSTSIAREQAAQVLHRRLTISLGSCMLPVPLDPQVI